MKKKLVKIFDDSTQLYKKHHSDYTDLEGRNEEKISIIRKRMNEKKRLMEKTNFLRNK